MEAVCSSETLEHTKALGGDRQLKITPNLKTYNDYGFVIRFQ
jgi:hypothetical protein